MAKDKTIIRTRKNRENPYVMIDKTGINDDRLSWKAKGILVYLLSKPDDWTVRVDDLIKRAKDGRDAVKAGLRELEAYGYLSREQHRDENGKFGEIEYIVYERPQSIDTEGFEPQTENPSADDSTVNGKSVSGKPVDGKTVNGKSTPTNNELILNNDLTNNGWLGEASPSHVEPPSLDHALAWDLVKGTSEQHGLDKTQALEFYKVWRHYYPDASVAIVLATIRELLHDKWTLKNGKWTEMEYKNLTGLFHHRMKSWREMAAAYKDIDHG